jgi:hypothetical protein
MKKLLLPLLFVAFTFFKIDLFAQSKENSNPFAKGTWSYSNRSTLTYTGFKTKVNDDPKKFNFYIDPTYFITNGVGIGIEGRINSTVTTATNKTKATYTYYQGILALTYGRHITGIFNLYLKASAGLAKSRNQFDRSTLGNNPEVSTANYFSWRATLGAPIALPAAASFITPYVYYDHQKTTTSGITSFKEHTIQFGFRLESYIGRNGNNKNTPLSEGDYDKGANFFEMATPASLGFNKRQQYQNGSSATFAPTKTNSYNFSVGYNYYFINYLAGGINFIVNGSNLKSPGSTDFKRSFVLIQPNIVAHVPVKGPLQNLYLQAGYGFGQDSEGGLKRSTSQISARLGYNLFVSDNIAITPRIGYQHNKFVVKNEGSRKGEIAIESGLAAEIGIRVWLNLFR